MRLYLTLLVNVSVALAQVNPGVTNTLNSCRTASLFTSGQVVYFSPIDTDTYAVLAVSLNSCTPNSYAPVAINYPDGITINGNVGSQFCGYLKLDGSQQVINW
jgi:hypothetical protein